MKKLIVFIGLMIVACLSSIPSKPIVYAKELTTPEELIQHFAQFYGADEALLLKVAYCESRLNYKARGDGGYAVGIFQFHQPTWDRFSKDLGEELNIQSSYDQAKLASWAFSRGLQFHWTCTKLVS